MLPGSPQTMTFGPLAINQSCEESSCKQVVLVLGAIAPDLVVVLVVLAQPDRDDARLPDLADARFFIATFVTLLGEGCRGTWSMWTVGAMAVLFRGTHQPHQVACRH